MNRGVYLRDSVGQTNPRKNQTLGRNFTISTERFEGPKGREVGIFAGGYRDRSRRILEKGEIEARSRDDGAKEEGLVLETRRDERDGCLSLRKIQGSRQGVNL